jgi:hypothetical protein
MIHCPGHQEGTTEIARGSRLADKAEREATQASTDSTLIALLLTVLPDIPEYILLKINEIRQNAKEFIEKMVADL